MKESGTQGNARSEVFEYGNENHLAYEDRWFGRFGDVLISSNRQTACTTKSTFSASECRSNLRDS